MALYKSDKKKKKKKKKLSWKIKLGVPFFLIAILIWYGFQPITGTKEYALCRLFVELQIKYPDTLKVLSNERFQSEERVYYVYIGPYGERKIEMMGCKFGTDPETGRYIMTSASLNRNPVPQSKIDGFNKGLPYVRQMDLNRIKPRRWDGTYMGLKDE